MVPPEHLTGKTFVVTGANTGIGRATATGLAAQGARVILACRSAARTEPVIDDIASSTGNHQLEFLAVDLADLDSVRQATTELTRRGDPIDVVIANAGIAGQRGQTAQGFELAFGVNHLGHFLLVTSLIDLMTSTSPGRVIVVSSNSHFQAHDLDEVHLRRPTRTITGMAEYARSKLANVCFTQEMARRIPAERLTVHAVHPGVIASDIWRRVPWPIRPLMTRRMGSVDDGARTSLWCATADDLDGQSGGYYVDCAAQAASSVATPELARWLWTRSEEWIS